MVTIYCLALYSESDSETNTNPLCHIQIDRLVLETGLGKRGSEGQTNTETQLQRAAVSWFMVALMEHHQGMQNLRGVMMYNHYLHKDQRKALPTPLSWSKEGFASCHGSESLDRHLIRIHIQ